MSGSFSLKPRLSQRLTTSLSASLIQQFNLFQMPYTDLVNRIRQANEDNPFIEIIQEDILLPTDRTSTASSSTDHTPEFEAYTPAQEYTSLAAFLQSQCRYLSIDTKKQTIIMALIDALDQKGYLSDYTAIKKQLIKQYATTGHTIDTCLTMLQEFEPEGVGARSLVECLSIQVRALELDNTEVTDLMLNMITNHLDALGKAEYTQIAQALSCTTDQIKHIATYIQTSLHPIPAALFNNKEPIMHCIPSFDIQLTNGTLAITNLEHQQGITFTLSKHYQTILESKETDTKTKQFLQEKYHKAKELQRHIANRKKNLDALMAYLATTQRGFFDKGTDYLIPCLQKDVAQKIGLSPASVSRILSSKYCRTPHGVIPLKTLCPRVHFGYTKKRLTALLQDYFQRYPTYSDRKLSQLLKTKHLHIARRTVTLYRNRLQLKSSYKLGRSPLNILLFINLLLSTLSTHYR